MNLTKNKIIGIIAILIIALQVAYLFTVYKDQLNTVNELNVSINKKQKEIEELKQKLQKLPQLEDQLEKTKLQKNALIAQIPSSSSSAKDYSNIMDIAQANNLSKLEIETEETTIDEMGEFTIKEKMYKLTFLSSYAQSENFIRNLNRSYQTVQLKDLLIDNKVQEEKEAMLGTTYKGNGKDFVRTELTFVMFTNPDKSDKELYDSGFNIITNTNEPFDRLKDDQSSMPQDASGLPTENPEVGETAQPVRTRPATSNFGRAVFTLNLADILTSGDNFQFSGPGPNGNIYAGMRSSKEAFITLTIREDSYDIVIEDATGKVAQNSAIVRIDDLKMQINSAIANIDQNMPNIHVYVNNYTTRDIPVRLVGRGTGFVKIYNSLGQQVLPGQTLGKVSLVGQ